MSTSVVVEIDHGVAALTIAREERRDSLELVAMRMLEEALASARAFAAGFAGRVDRDTVDVAKRILNDASALPRPPRPWSTCWSSGRTRSRVPDAVT